MGRILSLLDPCITIAAGLLPGSSSEPWWSDANGIGGANAAAVKASLSLSGLASHHLDSVVEAVEIGAGGNDKTIRAVGDSAAGAGVTLSFGATKNDLVIHYESGVSTVDDVEDAIEALAGASKIVQVKTTGTAATVLSAPTDNFNATHLTGGLNRGHNVGGLGVDGAIVRVKVSNWNALAGLQLVAQRSNDPTGAGPWDWITSVPVVVGGGANQYLTVSGGKVVILAALATTYGIAVEFRAPGARRLRFGLLANDAGAITTFACTAGVEFFADSTQA